MSFQYKNSTVADLIEAHLLTTDVYILDSLTLESQQLIAADSPILASNQLSRAQRPNLNDSLVNKKSHDRFEVELHYTGVRPVDKWDNASCLCTTSITSVMCGRQRQLLADWTTYQCIWGGSEKEEEAG